MLQKKGKVEALIDIIIPIYNEEECIDELVKRLLKVMNNNKHLKINYIFINDGSTDRSYEILSNYANKFKFIKLINFSRNFGHQIAVTAGLDNANPNVDYVLIIDADLQDPPELLIDMYNKAKSGYDIVYGKRESRKGESFFKKVTAKIFYQLISKLCDIEIPTDTGDFRMINRKVLFAIQKMREKHRFIRGMVPWVGFKSTPLLYKRDERFSGVTKYPIGKMLRFAKDAIFSFSNTPLRIANFVGFSVVGFGIVSSIFLLFLRFFTKYTVPGITAVILIIIIMGGIQIIMIGIIGEYIGRIFEESKNRPLYIISEKTNIDSND